MCCEITRERPPKSPIYLNKCHRRLLKWHNKTNTLGRAKADTFFSNASDVCKDDDEDFGFNFPKSYEAREYWEMLDGKERSISTSLQKDLLNVILLIIPLIKSSLLLNEADERDIGVCAKKVRAALRLRKFSSWNAEVLHDEGTVLGVHPPGQSDNQANLFFTT